MKRMLRNIFYGKSAFTSGLIALTILGLIALGCTCNGKKLFDGQSDTNTAEKNTKDDKDPFSTPEKKEVKKSDASKGELPEDDELEEIIKTSLLDFDKAVKDEDFTEFYESTSKPFKDSISPRRLKSKFQKFIDGKADLTGIKSLTPDYSTRPKITKQGRFKVLEAKGEFPTKPNPSRFDLKYIPEGEDWKLISFAVYTTVYTKR